MRKSVVVAIMAISVGLSGSAHAGGRFEGFTRISGPAVQEIEISCEKIADHLVDNVRSLKAENKRLACEEKCYQDIKGNDWSASLMLNRCVLSCTARDVDIPEPKVASIDGGTTFIAVNRPHVEISEISCEENVEHLKASVGFLTKTHAKLSCELQCYEDDQEHSTGDDWDSVLLNRCIASCYIDSSLPNPS